MNRVLVLLTSVLFLNSAVRADVNVSTSLELTSLQITPSLTTGSFQVISPLYSFAVASVEDSVSGSDQDLETNSASAATLYATANATASTTTLTVSASSGVNIPDITASADTFNGGTNGQFELLFEIADTANSVENVTFNAAIQAGQSLMTTASGVSAFSEVNFQLILPDISSSPFLFYDNPVSIGPSAESMMATNTTLTGTALLQTNTPYYLFVEADSESSGLNVTPEPSYFLLVAGGLSFLFVLAARRRLRRG
jgi:hypothetical protein